MRDRYLKNNHCHLFTEIDVFKAKDSWTVLN